MQVDAIFRKMMSSGLTGSPYWVNTVDLNANSYQWNFLRSDLHLLFDAHLLSVEPDKKRIRLSKMLDKTEYLINKSSHICPFILEVYPNEKQLERHFDQFMAEQKFCVNRKIVLFILFLFINLYSPSEYWMAISTISSLYTKSMKLTQSSNYHTDLSHSSLMNKETAIGIVIFTTKDKYIWINSLIADLLSWLCVCTYLIPVTRFLKEFCF